MLSGGRKNRRKKTLVLPNTDSDARETDRDGREITTNTLGREK